MKLKLLCLAAFFCSPCLLEAKTNLLAGCRNCNLRQVSVVTAEAVVETSAVAPTRAVKTVVKSRGRVGGVRRLAEEQIVLCDPVNDTDMNVKG